MLVTTRMTGKPVTATPDELLIQARVKMGKGNFRRLPVVTDGQLVGIITDRDMQRHVGLMDRTTVKEAMTHKPITVTPGTTVEAAAQLLLKQKINGLPVVENTHLVGVITTSDILQAFLEVMGASEETSTRIDFVLDKEKNGLTEASRIVSQEGGEVLGVGTYRGKWGESRVCNLRFRSGDAHAIVQVLRERGFEVLGVYAVG